MGHSDVSSTTNIRDRILAALESSEQDDPQGVRARTLRLVKCAMRDRDVTARTQGQCEGCEDTDVRKLLETMVAQREISAREYDESGRITDAERVGGFIRVGITRCLNNSQATHGGYRWAVASSEQNG